MYSHRHHNLTPPQPPQGQDASTARERNDNIQVRAGLDVSPLSSIYLSISLSIYLSLYLSIYLAISIYPILSSSYLSIYLPFSPLPVVGRADELTSSSASPLVTPRLCSPFPPPPPFFLHQPVTPAATSGQPRYSYASASVSPEDLSKARASTAAKAKPETAASPAAAAGATETEERVLVVNSVDRKR